MFTCKTAQISSLLDKVIGATERSSINPIFEHVLIEVNEDNLTMLAADSTTYVRATMPLEKAKRKDSKPVGNLPPVGQEPTHSAGRQSGRPRLQTVISAW